jgi:hypothetical protein
MPVDNEAPEKPSPEDVALEKAFGEVGPLIKDGIITWEDLAQKIAPQPEIIKAPEKLPVARKVSDKLKLQVKKLPKVFGVVVPDKVRTLTEDEVIKLLDERDVLDDIADEMAKRKDDIRTTVLNHFDAKVREERCLEADNDGFMCWQPKEHDTDHRFQFVPVDKDGHFLPASEGEKWTEHAGSAEKKFSWERRVDSKATISPAILEALAEDPECEFISHDDYIAMTTQTRVFDKDKAMVAIQKNPKLLKAIAEATRAGSAGASFWTRKA